MRTAPTRGSAGPDNFGRALRLLVDWGFAEKELETIIWWANRGNWASRKAAWRLGFSFEGTVRRWLPQRGVLTDAWVGTLLKDDPREPRGSWLEAPTLTGTAVNLRPLRHTDVPRIVEACSDARTAHWLGGLPSPYSVDDALAWLESTTEGMATGHKVNWALADPGSDLLVGAITIFDLVPGAEGAIGYWTHPEARGRGAMTEACRAGGEVRLRTAGAADHPGFVGDRERRQPARPRGGRLHARGHRAAGHPDARRVRRHRPLRRDGRRARA